MKRATVLGAGFAGLTAAYYLQKAGFQVEIYEKEERCGGLINTVDTPWGRAETAANGFLATLNLEEVCRDIGIELVSASRLSRRRYIFRGRARRWPLSWGETLFMARRFIFARKEPLPGQTIAQWGRRVLGSPGTRYLLGPALQGIYAGDAEKLSSRLIMSRFFGKNKKKTRKGVLRGTVAPRKGMGEFTAQMERFLRSQGVIFYLNHASPPAVAARESAGAPEQVLILAAGAGGTAALLHGDSMPQAALALSQALAKIDFLPVVSATLFFAPAPAPTLRGFGCLMPRDEGIRALGVLFNSEIFPQVSAYRSETWIFGGATDREGILLTDAELLAQIEQDRARLYGAVRAGPVGLKIQRWPHGIPHYTVAHEEFLDKHHQDILDLESRGIYLAGNYLGSLGLSQILERTREMVGRMAYEGERRDG